MIFNLHYYFIIIRIHSSKCFKIFQQNYPHNSIYRNNYRNSWILLNLQLRINIKLDQNFLIFSFNSTNFNYCLAILILDNAL